MFRTLIKTLCLVIAMGFVTSASAYSAEQIAQALQWEKKWSKVTSRAIEKYTSRIRSGLESVESTRRDNAVKAVRRFMVDRFSWRNQGKNFVQILTQSCDRSTLNAMVDMKRGEIQSKSERKVLISQYQKCASPGYRKAMQHLYRETTGFKPQVERLIKQAKF